MSLRANRVGEAISQKVRDCFVAWFRYGLRPTQPTAPRNDGYSSKGMTDMPSILFKITVSSWLVTLMFAIQSCTPTRIEPATTIASPSPASPTLDSSTQISPVTPTLFVEMPQCTETAVPPTITEVQPSQVTAGGEITVIGTGGFTQDSCGGFNESARFFKLYLDHESVNDLLCYIHLCEVKIVLSDTIGSGVHCLSLEKDTCEIEFQVVQK